MLLLSVIGGMLLYTMINFNVYRFSLYSGLFITLRKNVGNFFLMTALIHLEHVHIDFLSAFTASMSSVIVTKNLS